MVRASSISTAIDALVEAAQADPARFEALYRKYLAQVYSYAFYELRDHHEAEDATERTFLAALTNLGRFEERARPADGEGASTFRVWLFQIARNAVAERRRRAASPARGAARGGRLASPAPSTSKADAARRDEARRPGRRSAGCPTTDAGRSILRFVDEMSTAEIAGVLGRSEGAVRVLIHRALRSVARDLDERRGDRRDRRTGRPRDRGARHRPLSRGAPRRPRRGADRGPTRASPMTPAAGPPTASPATCHGSTRRSGSRRRSPARLADARRGCGCRPPPARRACRPAARCRRPDRRDLAAIAATDDDPDRSPAAAHRRRAHLRGPLARRRRLRRVAAQPARRRPDGPRRPGRRPDEARLMPIKLPSFRARRDVYPRGPVDQVSVVRNDDLQQAARQGDAGLPDMRPPLPPVGRGAARASCSTLGHGPSATPASSRSTRSGSSTRRRTRTGWPRPRPRPGCATRPSGGPARWAGIPIAICVMDFGFMGGSMGAVVGEKVTRAAEHALEARVPLVVGQRLGRRADAGGHARADAAGQDAGGARTPARRAACRSCRSCPTRRPAACSRRSRRSATSTSPSRTR